ncbi:MAG TPA: hypothetical protein VHX52_05530 [Steroidobacteraceae bacterium]|jgi:hypothetical protein|nr:hypothetical protein [Steroidobacteraceae bacterium]
MSAERIPELLDSLEGEDHPAARELVRTVLELHGEALAALMQIAAADPDLTARIAADERVRGILLLHGLHPQAPEQRVRSALRAIPEVSIQALAVNAGELQLHIECVRAPPGARLRERIEQAVQEAVPDLDRVTIEGLPRAAIAIPVVVAS